MQIKIEIDLQPEELRRFLGLPEMTELPGELLALLKERVSAASESLDPSQFVKQNLDTIRHNSTGALRKLMSGVGIHLGGSEPDSTAPAQTSNESAAPTKKPAKRASRRKQ